MKICIWPDATVCLLEDVEEYSWKSDDYSVEEVPVETDMHAFAEEYVQDQPSLFSPR